MADRAITAGFSTANEIKAALHTSDAWLGARISERLDILDDARRMDRAYWRGACRGTIRTGAATATSQIGKFDAWLND